MSISSRTPKRICSIEFANLAFFASDYFESRKKCVRPKHTGRQAEALVASGVGIDGVAIETDKPDVGARLGDLGRWVAYSVCGALLVVPSAHAQTAPPPAASTPAAAATTTGNGSQFEMAFWQSVDSGSDPALYEEYLKQYPEGTFAGLARAKLAKLRAVAQPAPAVAVPVAPPAGLPPSAPPPSAPPPSAPLSSGAGATMPVPPADTVPVPPELGGGDENNPVLTGTLKSLGASQRLAEPAPPAPPIPEPPATGAALVPAPPVVPPAVPMPVPPPAAVPPPTQPQTIAVGPLPGDFALPPRPALAAVPAVELPASFCSAAVRNQFHDGPYSTAMAAAQRNTELTNAYMRELQALYDRNQLSGDPEPMNAVAAEARAYGPVAKAAGAAQSALLATFNALMAVPITKCEVAK